MDEQKFFTCAEFNEKTAANCLKHKEERMAFLDAFYQEIKAEERRRNWDMAALLLLGAGALMALGVLVGLLV